MPILRGLRKIGIFLNGGDEENRTPVKMRINSVDTLFFVFCVIFCVINFRKIRINDIVEAFPLRRNR